MGEVRAAAIRRGGGWGAASLLAAAVTGCGASQPAAGTPGAGTAASVTRGEQLYVATCQGCHGDEAGAGGILEAPPHNADGHTWHHPDAQLIDWILNGKPFTAMPGFADELSREDAESILAYIKTWWTDQQRAEQAEVSERYQEALDAQTDSP